MKKIITASFLSAFFTGLMAQKKVTFQVDMNNYAGGSFTTVYVSGNFNSWSGNSNALSDADKDGVWDGTIDITDDSIEYKFTMDNWSKQESLTEGSSCTKTTSGYTNRFVKLTGNTTLNKVCFESCAACSSVTKKSVTFNVNMKQYGSSFTKVYVSGDFNSWSGNSNELTDADGDKIYSGTFDITKDSIEYKFQVDNWAADEKLTSGSACTKTTGGYTNRFTKVSGTKVLNNVCWASCSECTNDITFKVDMNKHKGAAFTGVFVNGNFNGWCGNCNPMADADKDGIWEVKLPLPQDSIEFLFTLDGWAVKEMMKEGSSCTKTTAGYTNRFMKITGNAILDAVCFESCVSCANTKEKANVTFKVDMSKYTSSFTAVNLNGSFNGWCGTCNTLTDANNDKVYEITLPLNATDTFEYLFTLDGWATKETFTGGESCTKTTGQFTNRMGVVKADTTLPAVCWEKCVSCATLGNTAITANGVKVYPNPGNGLFVVNAMFSSMTSGTIEIMDVVGQKLYSKGFSGNSINTEINLNSAKPGMYLMVINTAEGSYQERIFINSK
ncbi:MAG: T9SS type A sorting domain-containing protein [Sphingomonadales bacterium]|nr:T9SS type A sorting domain-containing protein [Sphingomonadales bacterium]